MDDVYLSPSVIVDGFGGRLSINRGVEKVRELGVGVVSPDEDIPDIGDSNASLFGNLVAGSVVIEASESAEVLLRDRRGTSGNNEAVGIGRVADDQDLDGFFGHFVQDLTLGREDLSVLLDQVLALHAGEAREGTNEDYIVDVSEGLFGVGGNEYICTC